MVGMVRAGGHTGEAAHSSTAIACRGFTLASVLHAQFGVGNACGQAEGMAFPIRAGQSYIFHATGSGDLALPGCP